MLLTFLACMSVQPLTASIVGTTKGEFGVNQGTAHYTVKVDVPPGEGGMQPEVSLNYSSNGGNGYLGVGWSLGGISSVTRCAQTKAQDGPGHAFGVKYSDDDRFCLDGQRLVNIQGDYGANGTEYRTEIDTYSKIVSYGRSGYGPDWFKVYTKNGLIYEYGREDAALIAGATNTKRFWKVKRISDRFGHALEFSYTADAGLGVHRIAEIANGSEKMSFTYESRPDVIAGYQAGAPYEIDKRLKTITTPTGRTYNLIYSNDPSGAKRSKLASVTEGTPSGSLKTLNLTWSSDSDSEPIGNTPYVPEIGGLSNISTLDEFVYGDSVRYTELNGDGALDVCVREQSGIKCYLNDGHGGFPTAPQIDTDICAVNSTQYGECDDDMNYKSVMFMDMDGDGLSDLVYRSDEGLRIWKGTGSGFGSTPSVASTLLKDPTFDGNDEYAYFSSDTNVYVYYPELNGDGAPDMCYRSQQGIRCFFNDGSGNIPSSAQIDTTICADNDGEHGGCDDTINYATITFRDMDADGLSDLVYRSDDGLRIWKATGSGFESSPIESTILHDGTDEFGSNDGDNTNYLYFPELNGDGATDMCYRSDGGIKCYFNDGNGNFPTSPQIDTTVCANDDQAYGGCDDRENYMTIAFADLNMDGLSDLVYRSDGGIRIWRSEGTNFESSPLETEIMQNDSDAYGNNNENAFKTIRMADMNGDGVLDLIYFSSDHGILIYRNQEVGSRIDRFDNGVDQDIKIVYEPLTTEGLHLNYRLSGPAHFSGDDIELTPAIYVVASVDSSNGIGGYDTVDYEYAGFAVNKERGSLGFYWISSHDNTHEISTRTFFKQTFPYTGMPFVSYSNFFSGRFLKRSSLAYQDSIYYHGVDGLAIHQPYTYVNVERSYDPGSYKLVKEVAHYNCLDQEGVECSDAPQPAVESERGVGNVLKTYTVTSGLGGGSSNEVFNYYESGKSDKSDWIVGRLSRSEAFNGDDAYITKFDYDAATGILTDETLLAETDRELKKHYTYDGDGYKQSETVTATATGTSRTTSFVSGRFGPTEITNPLGHVETRTYDPRFGTVKTVAGDDGRSVSIEYDDMGRKTYEKKADGTTTRWYHNWYSAINGSRYVYYTYVSSNIAPITYTMYDAKGRETRRITRNVDGYWNYADKYYNAKGELYKESLPVDHTPTDFILKEYDEYGRLEKVTKPGPSGTTQIYTTAYYANETTVTDPKGHKKVTVKNALGKVVNVTDAYGTADESTVVYEYDPSGRLETTTTANGTITLDYDIAGNKNMMIDPDMGRWDYLYDAWGNLVEQWSSQATTVNVYDEIGRLKTRTVTGDDGNVFFSEYGYGEVKGTPDFGKLVETNNTITGAQYDKTTVNYDYSTNGCVSQKTLSTLGDGSMTMGFVYDGSCSKITDIVYPNGFSTTTHYKNGYPYEVVDASGNMLYRVDDLDAYGNITEEAYGNGVVGQRLHGRAGYLEIIRAGLGSPSLEEIQSTEYLYDEMGNTVERTDAKIGESGLSETFTYDALDRMLTFSVASDAVGPYERAKEYRYDAAGNITYQTGGSYGVSYDGVGNVVSSGNGRTYKYTPFNKPYEITDPSGASVQFYYGADGLRYKKTNGTVTTLYMDKFYELKTSSNMIEEMSFIYFGGKAVGRKTVTKDTSGQMTGQALNYYHTDALGSVTAITGDNGTVLERRSYEPFGRIRAIDYMGNLNDPLPNTVAFSTRSFTGHEQIEEIGGLIHMNGRVYDSTLGRFLSADPHVQAPDDSQSYNRYSYVRNNPLKYTDPSGYSWFSDFWKQYGKAITAIIVTAVVVAAVAWSMGLTLTVMAELTMGQSIVYGGLLGAVGGFTSGYMMTGTLQGALTGAKWGAISGAIAGGIGGGFGHGADPFWKTGSLHELGRSLIHGLSRGYIAAVQGGNFRAGFWSGFAASAFSPGTTMGGNGIGGFAARTTMAATVGGTASELGGGKFANGAVSGAFVHMFNAEMKTLYRGTYKNDSHIIAEMRDGDVVFAQRSLNFLLFRIPLKGFDFWNTEVLHEQIFYKANGELHSIGYSDGEWLADEKYVGYTFSEIYHTGQELNEAMFTSGWDPNDYDKWSHNCQDFADSVAVKIRYMQGY